MFVNEYKVGWQSSSLKNKFSGFRRAKREHLLSAIYSNNTLLTAGCCKSQFRYLKHWYRLLCPGLVEPILGHTISAEAGIWRFSILRINLFFELRSLENTILARVLFLFQERTWERPLEPFWIPLCVSSVGDVKGYCVLSNHCHIQILDVSHDLLNGFVSGLPFSSPPPPSPI